MATYHAKLVTFARGRGQSAVAAAAYRSGEKLRCEREGLTKYPRRNAADVLFKKLIGWTGTRAELWSHAELAENRKNAVVAREWTLALPKELTEGARESLATEFATWLARTYNVAVDLAGHRPRMKAGANQNYHAHVMFTTREVRDDSFGPKTRVFDDRAQGSREIAKIRLFWEQLVNRALDRAWLKVRVSAKKRAKPMPKLSLRQAAILREHNPGQAVSKTLKDLGSDGGKVQNVDKDNDDLELPPPPISGGSSKGKNAKL